MAETLGNPADRSAIQERLARLTPESRALWGQLTPPRLLCHLSDASRVALGEVIAKPNDSFLSRTLLKFLVIHTPMRPPPEKAMTAPEMLLTQPGDWQADMARCQAQLERVGTAPVGSAHPKFGPLSPEEWQRLGWKHYDHHLRQFGL